MPISTDPSTVTVPPAEHATAFRKRARVERCPARDELNVSWISPAGIASSSVAWHDVDHGPPAHGADRGRLEQEPVGRLRADACREHVTHLDRDVPAQHQHAGPARSGASTTVAGLMTSVAAGLGAGPAGPGPWPGSAGLGAGAAAGRVITTRHARDVASTRLPRISRKRRRCRPALAGARHGPGTGSSDHTARRAVAPPLPHAPLHTHPQRACGRGQTSEHPTRDNDPRGRRDHRRLRGDPQARLRRGRRRGRRPETDRQGTRQQPRRDHASLPHPGFRSHSRHRVPSVGAEPFRAAATLAAFASVVKFAEHRSERAPAGAAGPTAPRPPGSPRARPGRGTP